MILKLLFAEVKVVYNNEEFKKESEEYYLNAKTEDEKKNEKEGKYNQKYSQRFTIEAFGYLDKGKKMKIFEQIFQNNLYIPLGPRGSISKKDKIIMIDFEYELKGHNNFQHILEFLKTRIKKYTIKISNGSYEAIKALGG